MIRWRRAICVILIGLAMLACNLTNNATPVPAPTDIPAAAGIPALTVLWPPEGSAFVVREEIAVRVRATDSVGVTRIELRSEGTLLASVPSPEENGQPVFEAILSWTPTRTGPQTIEALAYRRRTGSDPVPLTLVVAAQTSDIAATPVPFGVTAQPGADTSGAACQVRVDIDNLRYRAGPSTEDTILGQLDLGETLYVNGQNAAGTWYRFPREGRNVWASASPAYSTEITSCAAAPVAR